MDIEMIACVVPEGEQGMAQLQVTPEEMEQVLAIIKCWHMTLLNLPRHLSGAEYAGEQEDRDYEIDCWD